MIVQESDILMAALDRRLQVDRVLMIDPLRAIADSSASTAGGTTAGAPAAGASTAGAPTDDASSSTVAGPREPVESTSAAVREILARLPLGQVVAARVVDVESTGQVIAEIDAGPDARTAAQNGGIPPALRVSLAWPQGGGDALAPGRTIALRVLAHRPMLLFQSAEIEAVDTPDAARGASLARWSSDALRLQTQGALPEMPGATPGAGPRRFDIPILEIDVETLGPADARDGVDDIPGRSSRSADMPAGASGSESPAWTSMTPLPSGWQQTSQIALDDVIVAHTTALVDGVESPLFARQPADTASPPTSFVPIVLQGPAWPGQPMELVVRREREDEQFDNPVLDHWCGEVVLDLPRLGRVAGHLSFSMQGLKLRLEGDDVGVDAMSGATADLARALADADLRVAGLIVARPSADTTRPSAPRSADAVDGRGA